MGFGKEDQSSCVFSFGHLMRRAHSLEKTLILGKIESKRRRGQQRMRWLESITDSMDTNSSKLQESVKDSGAWCAEVLGVAKSWIQLRIWTTNHSSSTWLIPVEFNHYQLTQVHSPIFPPSTLSSLAGSHFQCSHILRSRGDNCTSSKTQYLHKLFGLFPMGNL